MGRRDVLHGMMGVACVGPLADRTDRIWMIGDSNAWFLMKVLPRIVAQDGATLKGNPVGGTSIIWWSKATKELNQMRANYPDVLLIALGTNDAHFEQHAIPNFVGPLRKLMKRIRYRTDAQLVWVGPPSLSARPNRNIPKLIHMITQEHVLYLDSRGVHIPMWNDMVHPTVKGREIWARWIWRNLRTRVCVNV